MSETDAVSGWTNPRKWILSNSDGLGLQVIGPTPKQGELFFFWEGMVEEVELLRKVAEAAEEFDEPRLWKHVDCYCRGCVLRDALRAWKEANEVSSLRPRL